MVQKNWAEAMYEITPARSLQGSYRPIDRMTQYLVRIGASPLIRKAALAKSAFRVNSGKGPLATTCRVPREKASGVLLPAIKGCSGCLPPHRRCLNRAKAQLDHVMCRPSMGVTGRRRNIGRDFVGRDLYQGGKAGPEQTGLKVQVVRRCS